jgi:hypothetical protein
LRTITATKDILVLFLTNGNAGFTERFSTRLTLPDTLAILTKCLIALITLTNIRNSNVDTYTTTITIVFATAIESLCPTTLTHKRTNRDTAPITFMGPVRILHAVHANLSPSNTSSAHTASAISAFPVTIEDLATNFTFVTRLSTSHHVCSNPGTGHVRKL